MRTIVLSLVVSASVGCIDVSDGEPAATHDPAGEPSGPLPAQTAYGQHFYPSPYDCEAAKNRGEIPRTTTCKNQLLFCPDGSLSLYMGDFVDRGAYTVSGNQFDITMTRLGSSWRLLGSRSTDGTLSITYEGGSRPEEWQPANVADMYAVHCD